MIWVQVLTIITAVFGMFMWVRRETSADAKELRGMIIKVGDDIKKVGDDVKKESRDFHGRLCILEEKYGQIKVKTSL